MDQDIESALKVAADKADAFVGATSPNPPVGCVLLDAEGQVLAAEAHRKAGESHAEALAIAACRSAGQSHRIATVVVTLEPCNHHGRTPPCVEAILGTPARRVVIGAADPNPRVAGGGAARLKAAGLQVDFARDLGLDDAADACARLVAPFSKWVTTRRPWLVVKIALTADGGMIPPAGRKTFTSPESLALAHRLRRRADAVITGSGTVLADAPLFTIRHVADHPGKRRSLVVLDRRGRVDPAWLAASAERGFDVVQAASIDEALARLGEAGVVSALLEAGPTLTEAVLAAGLCDEQFVIRQSATPGAPDLVTHLTARSTSTCSPA